MEFPPVTMDEIKTTISMPPNKKAPGPDGIPNELIKIAQALLTPILKNLYNLCLKQGTYPTRWKEACTDIIKKTSKDNYTDPKTYRLIELLDTLGKLFEKIINNRLTY
ncbi:hypothetical protein O181_011632 [Austropuccinia psidii MF-1]|uniref:Reverse transcriptase domain-containing protein n=1 Tax=Austropuccinia psidii MF-1 TaxID=1389203 RepID=A0A9Q3BW32_9BASI|nr:hypothetical protein [Austropuccinia psidii MF-1]